MTNRPEYEALVRDIGALIFLGELKEKAPHEVAREIVNLTRLTPQSRRPHMNTLHDPSTFFSIIRDTIFNHTMSQPQVDGCNAILSSWSTLAPNSDPRFIAYSLATAYWETDHTMQPIAEFRKGINQPYGQPAGPYNQCYYGRGYVQLTWLANYQRASKKLNIDFVSNPDAAMLPDAAASIMILGMLQGWFTGRKLSDFFIGTRSDWVDARTIINAHDHAALIAAYALHFYHAILD
jgi:hypothetical protein